MNSISFKIPLKPISLNHSHKMASIRKKGGGRRLSRVKTDETKTYEIMFNFYLKQIADELNSFWSDYDPTKNAISLDAYFYVKKDSFFTKAKSIKNPRIEISRNSLDLDNVLKLAIDCIFNFSDRDDKAITYINAQKIPTNGDDCMIFKMTLTGFPVLHEILGSEFLKFED